MPIIHVDRTGSATWHGPGQIVVYPVVALKQPIDLHAWIRSVESGVIRTVRDEWGLPAQRIDGRAGVWLTGDGRLDRKICAISLKEEPLVSTLPDPHGRPLLRIEARNAHTPIEDKSEWIRTMARG